MVPSMLERGRRWLGPFVDVIRLRCFAPVSARILVWPMTSRTLSVLALALAVSSCSGREPRTHLTPPAASHAVVVSAPLPTPTDSAPVAPGTAVGHSKGVTAVAFSPDGKRLVTAGFDGEVLVWDTARGQLLRSLSLGPGFAHDLDVSPDGGTAVVALELPQDFVNGRWTAREPAHGAIRHFDLETGEVKRRIVGPNGCRSVKLYRDGLRALGACDRFVGVWDLSTGVQSWKGESTKELGWANGAVMSPAQDSVIGAFEGGVLLFWDAKDKNQPRTLQGYTVQYGGVAILPSGTQAVALGHDPHGEGPQLWDLERGVKLHSFGGHTGEAWALAVSPDGKLAATAEKDWNVRTWDVQTGKRLRTLEGHRHWVSSVAFSPDGQVIASVSRDRTVRLWNTGSGALVWTRGVVDGQPDAERDLPLVEPGTLPDRPPASLGEVKDSPIAEPSSTVPTVAEWNASRVLGFAGSAAMGCEARFLREWLRVSCRGESASGAAPDRVEVQGATGNTFLHHGKGVVSFVVPLPEGRTVTAWVTWREARERLRLQRSGGLRGGFDTLPLLLQDDARVVRGQRMCACERESRGERAACSVLDAISTQTVQTTNLHCYRTYEADCQALVECNRGEPGRLPGCPENTWQFMHQCHPKCTQGSASCPAGTKCNYLLDDKWGCN